MRWNAAYGVLVAVVAGASVLSLLAFIPAGSRFEPFTPGRAFVEHTPAPAWWASHSYDAQVAGGVPPAWKFAHTPTPTPTPTPVPTETPLPTWTPEPVWPTWTPEPVRAVPAVSGDWQAAVCALAWSCEEALYVIAHESGGNMWATNASSGACGLFQLLPCPGYDLQTQLAGAWAKYVDGGYSFWRHWFQWW